MNHFIRQQFMHIELKGSEQDGFAMQQRLPDLYYSKLLPAIEKVLDRCSVPDRLLIIDKLEIDLGNMDLDRFEHDLAASVTEALFSQMSILSISSDSKQNAVTGDLHYCENITNEWEMFMYFLNYGYLPWNYKLSSDKKPEEILAALLINSEPQTGRYFPAAAIADTLTRSNAVKRLILQFSLPFVRLLLEKIAPGSTNEMDNLIRHTETITLAPHELKLLRRLIAEETVSHAVTTKEISGDAIAKKVLEALRHLPDLFLRVSESFEDTWLDLKIPAGNKAEVETTHKPESNNEEFKAGIYIENAGLVLLHPFLPQFFEATGISRDSEIIEPEKALAMLHFLATGKLETPEYEMVLPKILCNIPLQASFPANVEIAENEINEAKALLDAVIKHWDVLQETSRDSLRGTFLLRQGKLSEKNDGDWLLQVEPSAFDILMDQLPWGISMVKLPWMKKILWVEWR